MIKHHNEVQANILQLIENEPNTKQRNKEIKATIDGYRHFLIKNGLTKEQIKQILNGVITK